jgi:hypothetical protein
MENALMNELIMSYFPQNRSDKMADIDRLICVQLEMNFKEEENSMHVYRKGKLLTDPITHAPIHPRKAIQDYFTERKWISEETPTVKGKNMSEFQKQWQEANPGKHTLSPEFTNDLNKHAKTVEGFDYYS